MVVGVQTQHRRATAAEWSASGKILADGELGVTKDTKIIKMGDGVNVWDDLPVAFEDLYLTIGGKASDSELLDGIGSDGFVKVLDATTTATADKVARRTAEGRLKAAAGVSTDDVVNYTQLTGGITTARQELVSRVVSANFTLQLGDAGSMIIVNNTNYTPAVTCTIPLNDAVAFPVGTFVDILTADKGPVTLSGSVGVTVFGQTTIFGAVSRSRILKTDTNGWIVMSIFQSPGPILRRKIKAGSDNTLPSAVFTRLRLDGADTAATYSRNTDTLGADQQWSSADLYRCYCRRAGWYDLKAQMNIGTAGTDRVYVQARVNSVEQELGGGNYRGGNDMSGKFSACVPLNVGDYVEAWGYTGGGGGQVSDSTFNHSVLEWAWLRPL